jgi:lactoylglutathione lyase
MQFKMVHENYNVFDLDRSLEFYKKALGLTEKRRITAKDGSFIIVYVGNDTTDFLLELTWLRDRDKPYDLGDQEFHLAFRTDDFEAAHALHKEWDASATRTSRWASTSSRIRTGTGWRSCQPGNKAYPKRSLV